MPEFFLSPESQRAIQQEITRRQQRFQAAQAQVTEAVAERLAQAHQLAPTASDQLKQAYAFSGMTPDEYAKLTMREATTYPEQGGGIAETVGNVLHGAGMGIWDYLVKPVVRGAFLLVDTAAEELVQRPLTAGLATLGGEAESFGQAYRDYGDSPLVNLLQGQRSTVDAQGNPVEGGALGTGFFPEGEFGARSQEERTLEIQGQTANFGRALTDATMGYWVGPGDAAYDITAGVSQFVGDVALDPVAWATLGTTKAISAAKGVAGARTLGRAVRAIPSTAADDIAEQVAKYGLVSSPRRSSVLLEQTERLFKNRKVLDEIAQSDAYTIMRRMKLDRLGLGRGDDRLADLIVRLGDTKTPEEAAEVLLDATRRGWVRERGFYKGAGRFVPNPKEWARNIRLDENLPEFRYGGIQPDKVVTAANKMDSARTIDGVLRLGKVGEADRAAIVTRALRASDNTELMQVVDDATRAIARRMEDVGVDPEDVETFLKSHRESMNRQTLYLLDEANRPSPPPWKKTKAVKIKASERLLGRRHRVREPFVAPDFEDAPKLYRGIRMDSQFEVTESGDLILREGSNFGGRQVGVSMTEFEDTAWDYATRQVGGGKVRSEAQGFVVEVDRSVIDPERLSVQAADEVMARGDVVVPAGKWRVRRTAAGDELASWIDSQAEQFAQMPDEELARSYVNAVEAAELDEFALGGDQLRGLPTEGLSSDIVANLGTNPNGELALEEIRRRIVSSASPESEARRWDAIVSDIAGNSPAVDRSLFSYLATQNADDFFEGVEEVPTVTASMIAHLNKQAIPVPDPTDVRRATVKYSGLRKVYQSNGWEMADSAARFVNKYLFKFPTLFTRIAYPLRNFLDNSARSAGAGYTSLWSHPKAWLSMGVLDPDKFRDVLTTADNVLDVGRGFRTFDGVYGKIDELDEAADFVRYTTDTGETITDSLSALREEISSTARSFKEVAEQTGALTRTASGMWADEAARDLGSFTTYYKGQKGFIRAWREQLGRFTNDPIAQRVADNTRWLDRDELIDNLIDDGLIDEVSKLGDDAREFFYGRGGTAVNRERVSEYVDYIEGHIESLTGNDPGLRRLIATADLNGVNFNDLTQNKRIDQILREQYGDRAPQVVSGSQVIDDMPRSKQLWKRSMDSVVDWMASRPENRFTRYPLIAQVFADDIARSMPTLADDALRQQLVKAASEAGFDEKLFSQIAQAAQDAAGHKGVVDSIEDVLDAAKLHSTDTMLDIAFDATRRSSFQEMADVIFPFWDAFAEVGQSWGRIVRDNPNVFARGMQGYQSARAQGQFYVNEHGTEVFAYPGGGILAQLLGVEGGSPQFEGAVSGLNLVTQGFGPGFGPLVQWAAGAFLPDGPDLQWVRDVVTPYGTSIERPADLTNPVNLADELMPAWLKKAINAATEGDYDPVAWNSAVGDAMKVLATSGTYDMSDPNDVRRLEEDAKKAGRWTLFLRSALQMGAPTGPSVEWDVQTDPDGTTHRVQTMAGAYYDLLQASGDQAVATEQFIEMYGVEPFWIAQGKTNELVEGPRTREGWNWISRHSDAAERHPDVIGYFVPAEDPTAPPDYGVYRKRLERGDIQSLTVEQQLALANKTKARTIYNVWRDRVENLPYTQKQRTLRVIRDALTEMFPGWDADVLGVSSKLDRDEKIRRLEAAVSDPALADSPVTEPLSIYLDKRRQVYEVIAARGGATTLGAQANADLADLLYRIGQELSARSPHFQGVWQTVLSSEVDT